MGADVDPMGKLNSTRAECVTLTFGSYEEFATKVGFIYEIRLK